jgi:hypothetical protein
MAQTVTLIPGDGIGPERAGGRGKMVVREGGGRMDFAATTAQSLLRRLRLRLRGGYDGRWRMRRRPPPRPPPRCAGEGGVVAEAFARPADPTDWERSADRRDASAAVAQRLCAVVAANSFARPSRGTGEMFEPASGSRPATPPCGRGFRSRGCRGRPCGGRRRRTRARPGR